jgi:hypothetical protein
LLGNRQFCPCVPPAHDAEIARDGDLKKDVLYATEDETAENGCPFPSEPIFVFVVKSNHKLGVVKVIDGAVFKTYLIGLQILVNKFIMYYILYNEKKTKELKNTRYRS